MEAQIVSLLLVARRHRHFRPRLSPSDLCPLPVQEEEEAELCPQISGQLTVSLAAGVAGSSSQLKVAAANIFM